MSLSTTVNGTVSCALQDDNELYPSFDTFMTAIQDAGKEKKAKNKETGVVVFPKIKKICLDIYRKIYARHRDRLSSLDKNDTRGAQKLEKVILLKRKKRDITEIDAAFAMYRDAEGSVYIISNDPNKFGLNLVLEAFENHIGQAVTKTMLNRTPDDAMRLVWILLDPENRATVQGILTGKKDQRRMDQSYCTTLAFFDEKASDFNNPAYVVRSPQLLHDIVDYETFDPNNVSFSLMCLSPSSMLKNYLLEPQADRISIQRDGKWLLATWEEYAKPKCKEALSRWNKETGGGDGTLPSFANYACAPWLAWVFCLDSEFDFLLHPAPREGSQSI
jgi:hypothetical protein